MNCPQCNNKLSATFYCRICGKSYLKDVQKNTANMLFNEALRQIKLQSNGAAIEKLQLAIIVDPSHMESLILLGKLFAQAGLYRDALKYFYRARKIAGDTLEITNAISKTTFLQKRLVVEKTEEIKEVPKETFNNFIYLKLSPLPPFEKEAFKEEIIFDPLNENEIKVWQKIAEIENTFPLGVGTASHLIEFFFQELRSHVDLIYLEGLIFLEKKPELALKKLYEVTKLKPQILNPYLYIVHTHYRNGEEKSLNEILDNFKLTVKGKSHLLNSLAEIYSSHNYFSEAKKILINSLNLDEKNIETLISLGNLEFRAKNFEQSAYWFYKAYEENPANEKSVLGVARSYFFCYKFSEAIQIIQKALSQIGESAELYIELSKNQWHCEKKKEAIKSARKALMLDKNNPMIHYYLGLYNFQEKKYKKAKIYFQKCLTLDESFSVDAYYYLAQCLIELSNKKEAILVLEKAQKNFPDSPKVKILLMQLKFLENK